MNEKGRYIYKNQIFESFLKYVDAIESDLLNEADLCTIPCPFFPQYKYSGAISAGRVIHSLSKMNFDSKNETHVALLNALYFSITHQNEAPDMTGKHWEIIGFQSSNPISDLRCTGLFGLYMPLLLFARSPKIANEFIRAANIPSREFPMMLVLINAAGNSCEVAQKSDILKGGKNIKDGIYIISLYFNGIAASISRQWKSSKKNFVNGFSIFEKVSNECSNNPHETINIAVSIDV